LVRREVNPADRRVKNVIATDAGRDVLRNIRGTMQAHRAVDTLDTKERATLYDLLERLRPAIESSGHPSIHDFTEFQRVLAPDGHLLLAFFETESEPVTAFDHKVAVAG
jgi:hypothetical protein